MRVEHDGYAFACKAIVSGFDSHGTLQTYRDSVTGVHEWLLTIKTWVRSLDTVPSDYAL